MDTNEILQGRVTVPTEIAPPGDNRRVWVRYLCDWEGTVQMSGEMERQWSARIKDISQGGVKVISDQPFETGSILSIEVSDVARTFLLQVIYSKPVLDGTWMLGCSFTAELSEPELAELLRR